MSQDLPLFIDAEKLHAIAGNADVQIVAVDTPADFAAGHIPGAVVIDMRDLMASRGSVGGLLPSDTALAELFSGAGLRNDATIVAYDRAGDGQAARLLYTLDVVGHEAIALLDGGLGAWQAAGFELETGYPPIKPSDFRIGRRPERIADRDWIEARLNDDDVTFMDVRSADEYAGRDVRSARGGHIPGAAHLDWLELKDDNGHLKPAAELESLLERRGIHKNDEVAAYCQTHVRSAYAYLVLKALGYQQLRGYPGAWSEWGNAQDTPVAAGDDRGG
jgi:thiosulfate/3-mercaptopyruvate sulfurtransferase